MASRASDLQRVHQTGDITVHITTLWDTCVRSAVRAGGSEVSGRRGVRTWESGLRGQAHRGSVDVRHVEKGVSCSRLQGHRHSQVGQTYGQVACGHLTTTQTHGEFPQTVD